MPVLCIFRSVFNKNGGQAIKRLPDEDSDEDSEPGPSKPKIQKTENPTDVLTKVRLCKVF